jgi:SAM-dependent methyltransferase
MRDRLKRMGILVFSVRLLRALGSQFGVNLALSVAAAVRFLREFRRFRNMDSNPAFSAAATDVLPYLRDRTSVTPLDPVYFYQDAWAAGNIFKHKPKHHYDIGSSAMTVGILSQFVPMTMVDIRPVELSLPNLLFRKGTVLALPFRDNTLESVSSLCVVEHIGLGRYGDELDPFGSEKAAKELVRVTKPGGRIYFSVPVDSSNRVYFNAHRAFTREYVLSLFSDCRLEEERYIYGTVMTDSYDAGRGFGTGLYLFVKKPRRRGR